MKDKLVAVHGNWHDEQICWIVSSYLKAYTLIMEKALSDEDDTQEMMLLYNEQLAHTFNTKADLVAYWHEHNKNATEAKFLAEQFYHYADDIYIQVEAVEVDIVNGVRV